MQNLEDLLCDLRYGVSNVVVNIADKAILSSLVWLEHLRNVSIIGENNFTVLCTNYGILHIQTCHVLTIQSITWIGCGRYDVRFNNRIPVQDVISSSIVVQKNIFQYLMGPAIYFGFQDSNFIINHCKFTNSNYYRDHSAAIGISYGSFYRDHDEYNLQIISNCDFSYDEGVKSIVYLENSDHVSIYYINTTFCNSQGVSIYLSHYCFLHITGDILFKNSRAENGAGIYISDHSTVVFGKNSNVKFINNSVNHNGSAIFISNHSSVTFEQNSVVTFNDNKGISGTIYSEDNSNITFKTTSQVTFNGNSVTQYGAAIYSFDNSHVTSMGSSNIIFSNNIVSTNERSRDMNFGGILFSSTHSHISFDGNSTIDFNNNSADVGAAIFSFYKSSITFKDRSRVMFNSNVAQYCGVLTSALFSSIAFDDNSKLSHF